MVNKWKLQINLEINIKYMKQNSEKYNFDKVHI